MTEQVLPRTRRGQRMMPFFTSLGSGKIGSSSPLGRGCLNLKPRASTGARPMALKTTAFGQLCRARRSPANTILVYSWRSALSQCTKRSLNRALQRNNMGTYRGLPFRSWAATPRTRSPRAATQLHRTSCRTCRPTWARAYFRR